ncbi:unnamed protein product [Cylindrotheca closterium]|uniref:Uncharacterized protein n=1 Tax=Cylindrotheca closterium TaxID=2856 RepID=A0AAD2CQF9_9STRA|nr:unnamed protein product [Cylindrotheca closterium]
MPNSLRYSIASLDLASLYCDEIDMAEVDVKVMKDRAKAETVLRKDLISSFCKFNAMVSLDDFSEDPESDGYVDTVRKILNHYEAAQHDITVDLRAFQSTIGTLIPEKETAENQKIKNVIGKNQKESRSAGTSDVVDSHKKTSSSWWNLSSIEETSKSSKESKSSRQNENGLTKKVRSRNAIRDNMVATRDTLVEFEANIACEETPKPRNRKKLKSKSRSLGSPVDVSGGDAGTNKQKKKKHHGSDEDGSSKRSKGSGGRRKKQGMRKCSSGDRLDIDALVTGRQQHQSKQKSRSNPTVNMNIPSEIFADVISAPKANFSWDNLRGGVKGKRRKQQHHQPYKPQQTVLYSSTKNGEAEEAVVVKVYLDDGLVPFYDIKLTHSGKEKQTTVAHLSALTSNCSNNRLQRCRSLGAATAACGRAAREDVGHLSALKSRKSNNRLPRRRSLVAAGRVACRADASPVSVRRRRPTKKQPTASSSAPNLHDSPSPMRQKLSNVRSPGTLRKAYRYL